MRAIQITGAGGPEVLQRVDLPTPSPGADEVLVRNHAIGLNFIDVYQRTGLYPLTYPAVLGREAAGVVEAVGAEVQGFQPGDRVAYASGQGAYAEATAVKASAVVQLPEHIEFTTAAAAMLKGLTAEFLARRIWPLQRGDTVLVHAAAGGVGLLLSQWLRALGLVVIGSVGSEAKAEVARAHGCSHIILYQQESVPERVREITSGQGVKVAYDSVGQATLQGSLDSLARRGLLVSFGNASGPAPAVAPLELMRRGSLYMTRPTLFDYIGTRSELEAGAEALFQAIGTGALKVTVGQTFGLDQAGEAHQALEARSTTGATILIP